MGTKKVGAFSSPHKKADLMMDLWYRDVKQKMAA